MVPELITETPCPMRTLPTHCTPPPFERVLGTYPCQQRADTIPYPMGPLTPLLTLALLILMGMPSRFYCRAPLPPGSPSPVYSPPLVDSAVEQCAHKGQISSTFRSRTVCQEQRAEMQRPGACSIAHFLHHAGGDSIAHDSVAPNALARRRLPDARLYCPRVALLRPICVSCNM